MGTFQISYEDFSGGQYMGNKSTNLPKNQFTGENVVALPDGRLAPVGALTAGTYAPTGTFTSASILDHWVIGDTKSNAYVFANWFTSPSTNSSRMIKWTAINNGTLFPLTTSTSAPNTATVTTLTGTLAGEVAYDNNSAKFYYVSTAGNIYSVTTAGTVVLVSTALAGLGITDIAVYGYRLVAWGGTNKRLYYSDVTGATWATNNYYEFTGTILNLLVRTNDVVVITENGVFSLVGVLGSNITNQLIVAQANITEGMRDATVVGRASYFLDQSLAGSIDGSIYRLTGSQVQAVATMLTDDMITNQAFGLEQARVSSVNDGRLVVMLRSGIAYAETTPGTWSRLNFSSSLIEKASTKQQQIGRAGANSLNEYFMVASVDKNTAPTYTIKLDRFIHHINGLTNADNDFTYSSTASTSSNRPTGTVTLSEYWHSKPFTVKEMFVEYESTANSDIKASIIPTGNIDVVSANVLSMTSSGVANMTQSSSATVTERFRPNDANKGFGVKPKLTIQSAIVKRVILNCED